MSLNRNAKGLKTDRRLEREMFRLEEHREVNFQFMQEDAMLPNRPKRDHLWAVPEDSYVYFNQDYSRMFFQFYCMNCWCEIVAHENGGVHKATGLARCWRKSLASVRPMPGIYVIEELEIS